MDDEEGKNSIMSASHEDLQTYLEIQFKEKLASLQWCQKKNLLGVILENGCFQMYRANFKATKIKEIIPTHDSDKTTSFAFSPDCELMVVANSQGDLLVSKIGEHFEIRKRPSKSSIMFVKWLHLAKAKELININPLARNSEVDKFIPQIEAHKGSKEDNLKKLNLYNEIPQSYSLLCAMDADQKLSLIVNGYCDLATLNLQQLLSSNLLLT